MAFPPLAADLVGDELVLGLAVGDAQQRLGEAHEHHALFRGERILLHEGIDPTLLTAPCPHRRHQLAGQLGNLPALFRGKARLPGKLSHRLSFVGEQHRRDPCAARQIGHQQLPSRSYAIFLRQTGRSDRSRHFSCRIWVPL